jgi:hypothetical protein
VLIVKRFHKHDASSWKHAHDNIHGPIKGDKALLITRRLKNYLQREQMSTIFAHVNLLRGQLGDATSATESLNVIISCMYKINVKENQIEFLGDGGPCVVVKTMNQGERILSRDEYRCTMMAT